MGHRTARFGAGTPPRRLFRDGEAWRPVFYGVAIVLMSLAVAAWFTFGAVDRTAAERDPETLCLVNAPVPIATLTMLDQTDPLAANAGPRFVRLIRRIRDDLPRNGRLTIVPFGGDLGKPLRVAFDVCSPGRRSEANEFSEGPVKLQREYEGKFLKPLDGVAAALREPLESDFSPVVAQIQRAVNDPAIPWRGHQRVLNILTDGLEHTTESKIYGGASLHLPPPPPDLLRGVTVNYYELTSADHHHLQTPELRAAWKAWFEAAGAEVNMYAPGYAPPDW